MRMLDQDEHEAREKATALRSGEFASLTSRAVTEQARALVNDVYRLVVVDEAQQGVRRRKRGDAKADKFRDAVGAFVGELLRAARSHSLAAGYGWAFRSVSPNSFTGGNVSFRHFDSVRRSLNRLGLIEEKESVDQWCAFGVERRYSTRFRATESLIELAVRFGVSPVEAGKHFIKELPKQPLVLRGSSSQQPGRYKMPGMIMTFEYTDDLRAMEQTIIDLNSFLDGFAIGGGRHRGYVRVFNLGDHRAFKWNLGGRLYSQDSDSYQQMPGSERLKMTINGEAVCELDIRASYLTIFHAQRGEPLSCENDPYLLCGPGDAARLAVKLFIAGAFGSSALPKRWSSGAVDDFREETQQELRKAYPVGAMRAAVVKAYPLLAGLRQGPENPAAWAELMYLESEAVLRTMLALKERNIPSLSVHDSLIVPASEEETARELLEDHYHATTAGMPTIRVKRPDSRLLALGSL